MRYRDSPAHTVRAVMAVVVMMVKIAWWAVEVLLNDDRRGHDVLDDHRARRNAGGRYSNRRSGGPNRRVLHGGDYFARDSLLSQKDDVTRLQRRGHAVRSDVIHYQIGRDTGACHLHSIVRGDRPNRDLHVVGGHLLGDLRLVARFDVIQSVADQPAADGPSSGANQCTRAGVANSVPDDRAYAGAAQTAEQSALIGVIRGSAAGKCNNREDGQREAGNGETHISHILARKTRLKTQRRTSRGAALVADSWSCVKSDC